MVLEIFPIDESLQSDEILESVATRLTSSEVFTALFVLEMAGRIRQLPGKNYLRTLRLRKSFHRLQKLSILRGLRPFLCL